MNDILLEHRSLWEEKLNLASRDNELRLAAESNKVLIEVAAQHPLKNGIEPDIEFASRLDFCAWLYEGLCGSCKVEVYVPGSLHIPDHKELSSAGIEYLVKKGLPSSVLHGKDIEDEFKEERYWTGTYNSADECYLAARYFHRHKFSTLYCVCSPLQVFRKMLFYIHMDIVPMIYTVPVEKPFHKMIDELYDQIPYILNNVPGSNKCTDTDHAETDSPWKPDAFFKGIGYLQNPDSQQADYARKTRMPGYFADSTGHPRK